MKKKKHLADLMEEDLLETIQQRINELNDNEAREHFLERLDRLKRKRDDQKNALLEQQRLRREERERTKVQARAAEEQARREREAQENFLERSKWLVGKWNTPDGVYTFIDTDLDSGFYGQNGKTPFLCFTKLSEEDENRLQFEWDGKPIYATVDGETLLWDDGDTYTRHDEQKEKQRIQREQLQGKLAGEWISIENDASEDEASTTRDDPETDFTSLLFGGKWKTWDEDGIPEGTCVCAGFKHSLHAQWNDGSPPVQFRFTGRESDRFWFECHGDAVSAVFNGDQMTWDGGCIWKPEIAWTS